MSLHCAFYALGTKLWGHMQTVAYNIFHIFLLHLVYNELYRLSQFIHKAWKLKYSTETFDTCSKFQDKIWEWIMNVHVVGGVRERIMKTCHPISSSNVSLEYIQILVTSTYSIGHFRPAVRCGKKCGSCIFQNNLIIN